MSGWHVKKSKDGLCGEAKGSRHKDSEGKKETRVHDRIEWVRKHLYGCFHNSDGVVIGGSTKVPINIFLIQSKSRSIKHTI